MKRLLCIFLTILLTCLNCSCATKQPKVPVTYYYRSASIGYWTDTGVIAAEIREAGRHSEDYRYLIEQYLNGPRSDECTFPFPAGTTLESFDLDSNKAIVVLSPHLALLSGHELIIACACLTKTVLGMTGVYSIQISADSGLLNSEEVLTFTQDSFLFLDEGSNQAQAPRK